MINFTCMQNVKIMVGENCHSDIGQALQEAGYKKAFVIFDGNIKATGIVDKILMSIKNAGLEYAEFDKVVPDPPSEIVDEGGELCIKEGCDCVVAIGGGSAIDMGKGINILRVNGGHILDYANPNVEMKKCLGLMSVPTTSGTGSELSNGLIISDLANSTKVPILAVNAMSEFAVIDPVLSMGMPKGLTIASGLDVFSHAAEGYTSAISNPMTDMLTYAIMENVVKYLPTAANDGGNMEARTNMHIAASLGGWMLGNPSAHVGHSIAHVLGGEYHIAHGICCVYSLPVVLEAISDTMPSKVKAIGEILGAEFDGNETPKEIGEKTAKAYKIFAYEKLGVKKIDEFISSAVDYTELTNRIVNEPLAGLSPVKITEDVAKEMLEKIFE